MIERIKATFPQGIIEISEQNNQLLLTVEPAVLLKLCQVIQEAGYDYPANITAVDDGQNLRLVYHLFAISQKRYVVLNVAVARKGGRAPSVAAIWRGAEWFEREIFDLFGVSFDGNPDLRRILLPPDWKDIPPLLKDYKLGGSAEA